MGDMPSWLLCEGLAMVRGHQTPPSVTHNPIAAISVADVRVALQDAELAANRVHCAGWQIEVCVLQSPFDLKVFDASQVLQRLTGEADRAAHTLAAALALTAPVARAGRSACTC